MTGPGQGYLVSDLCHNQSAHRPFLTDLRHNFGALHTGRPGGTVGPLRETPQAPRCEVRVCGGEEMVPAGGAGRFLLNQRQSGAPQREQGAGENGRLLESMVNKGAWGGARLQSQKPKRKLRQEDVFNASLGYTMNLRS